MLKQIEKIMAVLYQTFKVLGNVVITFWPVEFFIAHYGVFFYIKRAQQ